ncbi:MAG: penicillin-insensitive murein endopeptidase [Beijerinckiaceae bacterium]
MSLGRTIFLSAACCLAVLSSACAQTRGTLSGVSLPPLKNPESLANPAKEVFGRKLLPADMQARSIGFYSRGCLAGAEAVPLDGDAWQVMRPSRNRNWGHPVMVDVVKRIARKGRKDGVWSGLLVGDISQARGGPMLTGHASHQIGLDADIWFTEMPGHKQTRKEREFTSAVDMVRKDRKDIDPNVWSDRQLKIVRIAAKQPEVERILVNAAIKKALCRYRGADRGWLAKVRPYWGHNYHFHIRISCQNGSPDCRRQQAVGGGDGCGQELAWWFSPAVLNPPKPKKPPKKRPPVTMAQMPAACLTIARAPEKK